MIFISERMEIYRKVSTILLYIYAFKHKRWQGGGRGETMSPRAFLSATKFSLFLMILKKKEKENLL